MKARRRQDKNEDEGTVKMKVVLLRILSLCFFSVFLPALVFFWCVKNTCVDKRKTIIKGEGNSYSVAAH